MLQLASTVVVEESAAYSNNLEFVQRSHVTLSNIGWLIFIQGLGAVCQHSYKLNGEFYGCTLKTSSLTSLNENHPLTTSKGSQLELIAKKLQQLLLLVSIKDGGPKGISLQALFGKRHAICRKT